MFKRKWQVVAVESKPFGKQLGDPLALFYTKRGADLNATDLNRTRRFMYPDSKYHFHVIPR